MPKIKTIQKTVYSFDELTDSAQERACNWIAEGNLETWQPWFEDFVTCGELLGIRFDVRYVPLVSGKKRAEPKIWYSVGGRDEHCTFEGAWTSRADALDKIKDHAPQDTELHRIAGELVRAHTWARLHGSDSVAALVESSTRGVPNIEAVDVDDDTVAETIQTAIKDFATWMLRQLRADYEWQSSDECVLDQVREYEYDENGRVA